MARDPISKCLSLDGSIRVPGGGTEWVPRLDFARSFGKSPLALALPSQPAPVAALAAPGGFLWWYADLRNASGDGAVLIWSFGLPFLPGYRRMRDATPAEHPALNMVVYRSGKPVFYHLQRFQSSDVEMSADQTRFRFGPSKIRLSLLPAGGVGVYADLRLRESGSGAEARVAFSVQGKAAVWCASDEGREGHAGATEGGAVTASSDDRETGASSAHAWTPLLASGSGVCTLETPTLSLRIAGEAYLDRNHSTKSLHALGIKRWDWGRVSAGGDTYAFYVLEGKANGARSSCVFRFSADGSVVHLRGWRAELLSPRPSRYGVWVPRGVAIFEGKVAKLTLRRGAVVDQGPFYVRSFLEDCGDQGWRGTSEVIMPARIDLPWQAPLVRMRVQPQPGKRPSPFLPLFQGSKPDRLRRLVRGALNGLRWRPGA